MGKDFKKQIIDAESRAKQAINYLVGTDALSSHDYIPEITEEFMRVWDTAVEEAAKAVDSSIPHYLRSHYAALIRELKRETTE